MNYFIYFLIFAAALMRVIPHPANFTPLAAVALFGAVYLSRKEAMFIPLSAMVVSDAIIGFDSLQSRLVIYSCFLAIALIGMWVKNHKNLVTVVGGSVAGSVLFYLVTNLVFLYPPTMYPHTWVGQITSYTNALPFFRNTLAGDLFFVAVLFGSFELVKAWTANKSEALSTKS